ncbi:26.5 kDa heat shock protein, mitochondrial-like [Rhododendron vialii]|uniref:26.5 kDa heat shock protein, mitochondrial-like n=1 Tax=Rhododendron vialii TaxID=182163 RepID=UPI00265E80D3|nr:26.5 kDa heat shock protein, mitochondrial-like [Rhododendron vialii]
MALGRLGLKYIMGKWWMVVSSPSFVCKSLGERISSTTLSLRRLSTVVPAAVGEKSEGGGEVVVCNGEKKLGLFPKRRRPSGFWTSHHLHRDDEDSVPADLYLLFPSGLGDALMQASKNVNKLLEKLPPSELIGRVNEQDDRYELRYEVPPRMFQDDMKIEIDYDCILTLKAEHKKGEEEEQGCCSVRLVLPEDAQVDEIKAQMENGVLVITIPRSGGGPKLGDVKEVQTDH